MLSSRLWCLLCRIEVELCSALAPTRAFAREWKALVWRGYNDMGPTWGRSTAATPVPPRRPREEVAAVVQTPRSRLFETDRCSCLRPVRPNQWKRVDMGRRQCDILIHQRGWRNPAATVTKQSFFRTRPTVTGVFWRSDSYWAVRRYHFRKHGYRE